MNQRVKFVASGPYHYIAINGLYFFQEFNIVSELGECFSYGWNGLGQCGTDSTEQQISKPTKITMHDIKIKKSACGNAHTLLLSETGDLYGIGSNEYGALGLFKKISFPTPTLIETCKDSKSHEIELENVIDIACGARHSIVSSLDGHVYASGYSAYGQCVGVQNKVQFEQIFSQKNARVACGNWNTFIF